MLAKDLKEELNKFEDDDQIFIRVKSEDGVITLVDFEAIDKSSLGDFGVIVPLFKLGNKQE